MRPRWYELGMVAVLLTAGCKLSSNPKPMYPADPLFAEKEPARPATPTPNPLMYASAAPAPRPPQRPRLIQAGPPAVAEGLPKQPADDFDPSPTSFVSVSRSLSQAAIFAHADDYSWLQGTLHKHYKGSFELRYREPTEPDPWGGRVLLEPDCRLQSFQDGDVVRVEGTMLPSFEPIENRDSVRPGRYRIRTIRLLRTDG